MHGHGSSTGNGMRLDLLRLLEKKQNKVTYIGSQESGNMTNKYSEGHPGATIKEMPGFYKDTIKQNPNVILVFVGTNDNYNPGSETAHERMGLVVDDLVKQAPKAAILIAQITTVTSNEKAAKNIASFNKNLIPVIKKRADKGAHVALVDMGKILKPEDLSKDGKHPNDKGHAKIAKAWYKGLSRAASKGWIKEPLKAGSNSTEPAKKADEDTNKIKTTDQVSKKEGLNVAKDGNQPGLDSTTAEKEPAKTN